MLLKIGIGCLEENFYSIEWGDDCLCLSRCIIRGSEEDKAGKSAQRIPRFHRQDLSVRYSGDFAYCVGQGQHLNSYEREPAKEHADRLRVLLGKFRPGWYLIRSENAGPQISPH